MVVVIEVVVMVLLVVPGLVCVCECVYLCVCVCECVSESVLSRCEHFHFSQFLMTTFKVFMLTLSLYIPYIYVDTLYIQIHMLTIYPDICVDPLYI